MDLNDDQFLKIRRGRYGPLQVVEICIHRNDGLEAATAISLESLQRRPFTLEQIDHLASELQQGQFFQEQC